MMTWVRRLPRLSCPCLSSEAPLDSRVSPIDTSSLDELLELSDRLVVMFHGEFVHEARASEADLTEIGRHMAGH